MQIYDHLIIGAGAAGLFLAGEILASSGSKSLVLEGNSKPGLKIQVSGGGRCNFTNNLVESKNFVSTNTHFSKSALARYSCWDFIELVAKNNIEYYEKKLGQLFCKKNSKQIIELLLSRINQNNVEIKYSQKVISCTKNEYFEIKTRSSETFFSKNLIVASGGLSFSKLGATDVGYNIAKRFDLKLIKREASLVPLMLNGFSDLAGVSVSVNAKVGKVEIEDDLLFTHTGLSGPCILKISLYWQIGESIFIDFIPGQDLEHLIIGLKKQNSKEKIVTILKEFLPQKFVTFFFTKIPVINKKISELSDSEIKIIANHFTNWKCTPHALGSYDKAEVTRGGVCTSEVSSKTMESHKVKGLYFIGEVLDVTGLLGGYNFQWAWSSAYAAACNLNKKGIS
jgi:hypothetical protein